ncbi:S1C family serine protease [Geothrix sp. 21YS21S-4]|uniref:S1C family serine protease n=1 Tax=Geothrix sp. 21YS21S-4 TaxID=3068889 RepID=UPI0027BADDC4|nr:S1C family serine protease [Geothrix sp. 21YS21S-4]
MADSSRSPWTPLAFVAAVALAAAGGAGLVRWREGRRPAPAFSAPAAAPQPPLPEVPAPEPAGSATSAAPSTEDVVARVLPAVVMVETGSGRSGSAFFVGRDRLLTNHHVIVGRSYVKLRLADGSVLDARIEATAAGYDLAVLHLMQPGPERAFLPLGTVQEVRPGQEVLAVGTPLGLLQNTVTRGIVSSLRRLDRVVVLQTDTALNPGNSGGPLVDRAGRAVGITTMGFRGSQGLNFAVAIDHARALLDGKPLQLAFVPSGPDEGMKALLPGAGPSETDRLREEGTRRYAARLEAIARGADQLESAFASFLTYDWEGRAVGTFDRNFYAFWERGALQGESVKGREARGAGLRQAVDGLRDRFREAEEEARRADVFPGTRRDLRHRYRLDDRRWE